MAKITELPQATTLAVGDLLAIVTNVSTIPTTKKIAISDFNAGFVTLNVQLVDQVAAESYQRVNTTFFGDGAVSSATVVWPDGSTGTFTTTTHNVTWAAVDAFTVTHTTSGKTVTQPVVTRDGSGRVTIKPVLVVTP